MAPIAAAGDEAMQGKEPSRLPPASSMKVDDIVDAEVEAQVQGDVAGGSVLSPGRKVTDAHGGARGFEGDRTFLSSEDAGIASH